MTIIEKYLQDCKEASKYIELYYPDSDNYAYYPVHIGELMGDNIKDFPEHGDLIFIVKDYDFIYTGLFYLSRSSNKYILSDIYPKELLQYVWGNNGSIEYPYMLDIFQKFTEEDESKLKASFDKEHEIQDINITEIDSIDSADFLSLLDILRDSLETQDFFLRNMYDGDYDGTLFDEYEGGASACSFIGVVGRLTDEFFQLSKEDQKEIGIKIYNLLEPIYNRKLVKDFHLTM